MESMICSIDIPDVNTEISIKARKYNSSIISKDNNILLFLLTNKKERRNSIFFYNKSIIINIGKNKTIFEINLNKFQYLINNKNNLYLKFKAFLNYINKVKEDIKESLIEDTFSFIKKYSIIESDLIMALIYHSYNTKYFDNIINYVDKIEKFDDELNLKEEEYINFYFNIIKETKFNEKIKIKFLKICLFYLFQIDNEKFMELFFSKEFDLNQNYQIIFNNSYLFRQWKKDFIEKSIIILEKRNDLIYVLFKIKYFIDLLFSFEKYYDKLKIVMDNKFIELFNNNIIFESNENEDNEILNIMDNINAKISKEKATKTYLTFFQNILLNHSKNNNKNLNVLFQYISKSKNVSNNKIYILNNLKQFYIWNIRKLKVKEIITFIENNLINNILFLPKEFNFQLILYFNFLNIKNEETIKINELIDNINEYYPQKFINKFYYNEDYSLTNLMEFYNYLIYVYEYKKILFNVDNIKIISRCFFHLCSITQITANEIINLDIILKFFEAEKIFKDIFNNYDGDLTENQALFFVLLLENKNIPNEIEKIILNLFEGFPIFKIFKYSKENFRTHIVGFPMVSPILIASMVNPGIINPITTENISFININKIFETKNEIKRDILYKMITFLKY